MLTLLFAALLMQQPPVVEQVDVDYVLLDVTVERRDGSAIDDLELSQLRLKINGVKLPIDSLDRHCDPVGESDSSAVVPTRTAIVLDYRHLERAQRYELLDFLEQSLPQHHRAG